MGTALAAGTASAQTDPRIPSGHIRIHYYRPDGLYTRWTVYAYGDTTQRKAFVDGPVGVTGTDSFGAYFDVGVTATAQNVGLISTTAPRRIPAVQNLSILQHRATSTGSFRQLHRDGLRVIQDVVFNHTYT